MGGGRVTVDVSGAFSKCRMTLPISMSEEVEHVGSGALSSHLTYRAITNGSLHPPPCSSLESACDSSLRVVGPSCVAQEFL